MAKQTRQDRHQPIQRHWQTHVKAQQQSGLNRADYCRQYKLPYHAMTYWHHKLLKPLSNKSILVPVPLRSIEQPPDQLQNSSLKIILPGSISVEVGNNFSPATLTRLLATLEGR
jgi:hypothetical protein